MPESTQVGDIVEFEISGRGEKGTVISISDDYVFVQIDNEKGVIHLSRDDVELFTE